MSGEADIRDISSIGIRNYVYTTEGRLAVPADQAELLKASGAKISGYQQGGMTREVCS